MSQTVQDGALITKDPADAVVIRMDWGSYNLAVGASIAQSSWAVTSVSVSGDTALVSDQSSIVSGARDTQVRLSAGTGDVRYQVDNTIVTNESPAQTKSRRFFVLVTDR